MRSLYKLLNFDKIIEFGILDEYFLSIFFKYTYCSIDACDIFDNFNGNHSDYNIINRFNEYKMLP